MRARIPGFEGRACALGLSPQFPLNREAPVPSADHIEMTACDGNIHVLGERVLLLVARMDPAERMKGHSALLSVLPALLRRHPEAQLVFEESGEDIPLHERRARELGVASSVFLPGMVPVELLARLPDDDYRYELVAVDHAVAVEQHRQARGVPGDGPVDDLRQAFLHHRALFQALLGGAGEDGDRRRGAGRAVVTEAAVVRP